MAESIIQYFWIFNYPNDFDSASGLPSASFRAMSGRHPLGKNSPQAQRLRRLREVMGIDGSASFAKFLGVTPQRWNNFEVGYPLSRDMANRVVAKIPGISRDWLEEGDPNRLSVEMARKLGELPETNEPKRARRG